MPIFLGLVGSLVIGISDFCARYVARRNHAATTAATGLIFATSAAVLVASFGPGGFWQPTTYLVVCPASPADARLRCYTGGWRFRRSLWCLQ